MKTKEWQQSVSISGKTNPLDIVSKVISRLIGSETCHISVCRHQLEIKLLVATATLELVGRGQALTFFNYLLLFSSLHHHHYMSQSIIHLYSKHEQNDKD